MKEIVIFCCPNDLCNAFDYVTKEHRNSLIHYDYKKCEFFFTSKFSKEKEWINVYSTKIDFEKDYEKLVNIVSEILKISYEKIKEISNECFGPFIEPEIYSEINSYIYRCSLDKDLDSNESPKTIFHFVGNLFFRYLMGHKMKNGNKRLSLLFLINLLNFFGFHLFYSKGVQKNYDYYKDEIANWVDKAKNLNIKSKEYKEKYLEKLVKWIKKNCCIAINFR